MIPSDESENPSALRLILRELPRRKVALVLLAVAVNMGAVMYLRGRAIAVSRPQRVYSWG
jgi:hypothetical protein